MPNDQMTQDTGSAAPLSPVDRIAAALEARDATPADDELEVPEAEAEEVAADPEEGEALSEDAADEEAPAPEPEAPVSITLKDGTVLTPDEVEKGYLRQSDYTKKTQAVAEARKAHEAEVEAVRQERALYAERLGQVEQVLKGQAPQEPPLELRQTDPAEWAARRAEVLAYQQELATVAQERQRVEQLNARDAEAKQMQYLNSEREKLLAAFPAWATNQEQASNDLLAMRQAGSEYGFSDAELDSVVDHRAVRLLYDVAQYKKQLASVAKVQPKIAKAPVLKPGTTGRVGAPESAQYRKVVTQAKQSGKRSDAEKALAEIFARTK